MIVTKVINIAGKKTDISGGILPVLPSETKIKLK